MNTLSSNTPYSPSFCHAVHFVLEREGGYVNDPLDAGGETQFGISKRSYPEVDIAALTIDDAIAIYHRDFWLRTGCDKLPDKAAFMLFDAAVQHGKRNAVKQLQRAVGVMDDGQAGPKTIAATECAPPSVLVTRFSLERARFYARLVGRKPKQRRFLNGWFNRIDELALEAITLA
ncbi:glycoside hydrolase family 108 protein [Enterovibrio norvegicus]|uniref:glycoside hydrolase family 108 protein n=1 Tax=Enterovibrio norvegicus TaxID=188144 RepID=UPI000C818461|nr:N-acetylmuramidase [Enterovibrio norvegicus]PMN73680.1 peptidoglycan-binding protein [Enterovibrio norvegicus]